MVPEFSSPNETSKDEPDILDLKANTVASEADAEETRESVAAPTAEDAVGAATSQSPWTSSGASASAAASSAGEPSPAERPLQRQTATSSLIGAGILGGLVALAAAASMQYAGYWPGGTRSSEGSTEVASLRSEVDGLKQQLASIPVTPVTDGALEKRLAALEAKNGSGGAADQQTASQIKTLEDTVTELKAAAASAANQSNQQLTEIGNRLASAEKTLKDQPGEAAVSKAIAATYLKAAVDRGDPFLTELQTFSSLSPDDPAIAGLKPLAATGIKSKAVIAKDFEETAKAISEALNQPVQGESMTDRLFASARSLISVRPVGNVTGNDWGAILARMEEKLKNGDVKGAALEWDSLPEAGKAASKDFKAELDARAKADDLTRGLAERNATPAVNAG